MQDSEHPTTTSSPSHELDMLGNGIAAIEIGFEDSISDDPRRAASAVRNFYSGLLLILKECIHRIDPEAIFTGKKGKSQSGQRSTINFDRTRKEWEKRGLGPLDWDRLSSLGGLRNDIEHRASTATPEMLRQAVASTFCVLVELLENQLGLDPLQYVDEDVWIKMHRAEQLYVARFHDCIASRKTIAAELDDFLRQIVLEKILCVYCYSDLLCFRDSLPYPRTSVECLACGSATSVGWFVEQWVEFERSQDLVKGLETNTHYTTCPTCTKDTYSREEDVCLVCRTKRPYEECRSCRVLLSLDDQANYAAAASLEFKWVAEAVVGMCRACANRIINASNEEQGLIVEDGKAGEEPPS